MSNFMTKLQSFGIANKKMDNPQFFQIFYYKNLRKGMGLTIGNCLRRTLLSCVPGYAIRSCTIDGVQHEFSAIDGIKESAQELIMNLKKVVFSGQEREVFAELSVNKAGDVYADSIVGSNVDVVNKDLYICSVSKSFDLKIRMQIEKSVGIILSSDVKDGEFEIGSIVCDSFFSPIEHVNFEVVEKEGYQDFEELKLSILTNGSISAEEAHQFALNVISEEFSKGTLKFEETKSNYVYDHKAQVKNAKINITPRHLDLKIEDLELSNRVISCLKSNNVYYVGQLVQCTEDDLMKHPNFGKNSLKLLTEKLTTLGLTLGMEVNWQVPADDKLFDDGFVI